MDVEKALKRALGGGLAAMRTVMNYQYKNGGSARGTFHLLYNEGGIRRFYRGVAPALLQGPLSRFGDTAANAGVLALLGSSPVTNDLPVAVKTVFASFASASFRIFLTPIDTVKTILQTTGKEGLTVLRQRIKVNGPTTLWYGALASATATFVGHYPWFATYNYMQENLPQFGNKLQHKLARNAVIGFTASITSDCISNSVRVVKTYRQTHSVKVSYPQAVKDVIAKDGVIGLFGRGLQTRILANGLQGE
ncbi:hypothetical protein HK099_002242 [Clydaea vesicula]|uniref:Mitochondrial carrier protein n=1 Tax=Clydaea vesicula TaxID=447962 RepID=A0AAD5U4K4_9FUNG|nr:hypothetical protein HK099_002242 [Clydaea vesicula]